ncbi:MAG: hypothetical protein KAG96_05730 [Ichthyobacteriaceae bacterium]|nr:hypothetical protein [Ichthyobacteriaceae bacterium]
MKSASVKDIKTELKHFSQNDLIEVVLRLSKFKKENKELLTYLLFEENNDDLFIKNIKEEIDELFKDINLKSYHYIKKSTRKILKIVKKYIHYSSRKETEVELMMHFCIKLKKLSNKHESYDETLDNILNRQIKSIKKTVSKLHEDLQYDYNREIDKVLS